MEPETKKQKMTYKLSLSLFDDMFTGVDMDSLNGLYDKGLYKEYRDAREQFSKHKMSDADFVNKLIELTESMNNIKIAKPS